MMRAQLEAEALIGDEARKFCESELGKVVLGLASQEREAAIAKFRDVDVGDHKAVREIQSIVWRADTFNAWLVDLITDGENALNVLRSEQKDE